MTEENITKLITTNQRLLLVLGFATSIILDMRRQMADPDDEHILWFVQAVENTVYKDEPLPPLP